MNDETIDYSNIPTPEKRPTFLTVLCVLTWIWAAYTICMSPVNYFFTSSESAESYESIFDDALSDMAEQDPKIAEMMEGFMVAANDVFQNALENAGWIFTTDLLVAILSALGAFFMFKLRKQGFLIYVAAKVLGLVSVLAFLGVNLVTVMTVSFAAFIGLIMIVLYAVNRKHMS